MKMMTNKTQMAQMMQQMKGEVFYPAQQFCTDNGAMIAYAGYLRLAAGQSEPTVVACKPRWDLAGLPPLSHVSP